MTASDDKDDKKVSPVRRQAADALRRARKLPIGPDRNDLRQLAIGLLWLERKGLAAKLEQRAAAMGNPDIDGSDRNDSSGETFRA